MPQQHVLVTGSSGFIGRALVKALRQRGERVLGADLKPPPDPSVETTIGDLREPNVVRGLFGPAPKAVFHLAAKTSVLQSAKDPQGTFEHNVAATQALLEGCRVSGVPAFVMASTNAVVGHTDAASFTDACALRPLTAYGATKAAGEMLCWAYAQSYGIAAAAVRLTNVYGPGMAGKDSFIIRLLRAAAGGTGIGFYGDGKQERDYIYLDDAVAALLLAWDKGVKGPLVVGSGQSVDCFAVHAAACAATGVAIPIEHREQAAGEMRAVRVDLSQAERLGFRPRFDLTAGLVETWRALGPELRTSE